MKAEKSNAVYSWVTCCKVHLYFFSSLPYIFLSPSLMLSWPIVDAISDFLLGTVGSLRNIYFNKIDILVYKNFPCFDAVCTRTSHVFRSDMIQDWINLHTEFKQSWKENKTDEVAEDLSWTICSLCALQQQYFICHFS